MISGKDPAEIIPSLNKQFDFAVIDSAHRHPVEVLNFLTILPFLKDGAIVVLHDISLSIAHDSNSHFSPRLLWGSVVADKLIPRSEYALLKDDGNLANAVCNIGAFQISRETRKYISNVFETLMFPWERYTPVVMDEIGIFLNNYYTEELTAIFSQAAKFNKVWCESKMSTFSESTSKVHIPIAMSTDENYVMPTCVSIQSILVHPLPSKFQYKFYLMLSEGVSDKSRKVFNKLFKLYPSASLEYIEMGSMFADFPTNRHISFPTYFRIMLPELLPQYEKCIYLDGDIIACGNLSDLFDIVLGENYIGGVREVFIKHALDTGRTDYPNSEEFCKKIGLPSLDQYINAGVLLMNLSSMRKDGISARLIEAVNEHIRFVDQDLFNIVCYNSIKHLPFKYNFTPTNVPTKQQLYNHFFPQNEVDEAVSNPTIVHCMGGRKPWDTLASPGAFYWYKYALQGPYGREVFEEAIHALKKGGGESHLQKTKNLNNQKSADMKEIERLQKKLTAVQNSTTFRIGRAVTFIPRAFKRWIFRFFKGGCHS